MAVLTAGERTHWARTRRSFFRSGINRTSLNDIERAAFVLILDDEEVSYDKVSALVMLYFSVWSLEVVLFNANLDVLLRL